MNEKIYTPYEVSRAYGIGESLLYRLVELNMIPYFRIGHSVRFTESGLIVWRKEFANVIKAIDTLKELSGCRNLRREKWKTF